MNNKRWRWGKIPHRLRSQALSLFDASRERMIWGLRRGCLIGPILFRLTAGASGFLNFSQSGERPDLFSL